MLWGFRAWYFGLSGLGFGLGFEVARRPIKEEHKKNQGELPRRAKAEPRITTKESQREEHKKKQR
jgi:hypothetical protein